MSVTGGQILKYTILPGVLPRIGEFFATGFGVIPFYIAFIFQAAGLLPRGHAYLDPRNVGRYGMRHILAEAASRLVFDRKHLDQILIFFIVVTGIVVIIMQMALFLSALFLNQQVFASGIAAYLGPFTPSGREQDIAYIFLDHVFGVRGIFGSCIQTNTCVNLNGQPLPSSFGPYPSPFHLALHTMLRFYSMGIFIVSVFVVIYFVITITAETAETGVPFGQRLNRAWAPVRLILCFALLMPLNIGGRNEGLNAAQHLILWSAKLGSNLATNAWIDFNNNLTNTFLGRSISLIGKPNAPPINELAQFMFVTKVCEISEETYYPNAAGTNRIDAYLVRDSQATGTTAGANYMPLATTTFAAAKAFSNNGFLTVVFGEQDQAQFKDSRGGVRPYCGELVLPVTKIEAPGSLASGATLIQEAYYNMIVTMWRDPQMALLAECHRKINSTINTDSTCTPVPDQAAMQNIITTYQTSLNSSISNAIAQQIMNGTFNVSASLAQKGWAGAAVWYNRVAEMNGDISTAAFSVPTPSSPAYVLNHIVKQKQKNNQGIMPENAFDPYLTGDDKMKFPRGQKDEDMAVVLNSAYALWQGSNLMEDTGQEPQGAFINTINAIFGTSGIFSMRQNASIHPLAQLSMLGKGMMYASLRNFSMGAVGGVAGGIAKGFSKLIGVSLKIASDFMLTMGLLTMAMSFVLYYVLPFMPFIYFIFAVGGWVKAIFEAFVAAPLWALAHLRIDGEGLPGQAANAGYFLILEIFLRPILIVFGLLASIEIFSALVIVMHDIFDLVVMNATGFDRAGEETGGLASKAAYIRGPVDEFFYTAIYVILCYMLGTGCFKLIDRIPASIMRWMGQGSIGPIREQVGDAADQVLSQTYQGATLATQRVSGGALAAILNK